ncbi:MAG: FMN-binding protein [Deltaproteobacteria bacterium]|nr:FMN-binding protein [Deltaproteobacteria bacterium]
MKLLLKSLLPAQRSLSLVALVALGWVTALPAHAETFWDKSSVLKAFFAKSERVTFARLTPTAAQAQALRSRLGYAPPTTWTVYYGMTRDRVDGLAVIDDELGQHLPITFAALIGTDGVLQRLEVMVYREAYGGDVAQPRFRNQFTGKTAADPVRHGRDIVAVAGATISSKSLAAGARRALVLADELVIKPGLARALPFAPQNAGGGNGAHAAGQR